jgi:flagellar biogenesis protein FliO
MSRVPLSVRRLWPVLPLLLLPGAQAWSQTLGQGVDSEISPWRILAALTLCIAVAIGAAVLLKSRMQGGKFPRLKSQGRRLQVLETTRLGAQNDVCIVACDGEELLLSSSPHGVSLIRTLGPRRDPS